MNDRINTIESQLETDLNAESDITDEFNLILKGFPESEDYKIFDYEIPVLAFEYERSEDVEPFTDNNDVVYERLHFVAVILNEGATMSTTKQKIKKLTSLLRSFFHSTSWSWWRETGVGESHIVATEDKIFKFGSITNFYVDVPYG